MLIKHSEEAGNVLNAGFHRDPAPTSRRGHRVWTGWLTIDCLRTIKPVDPRAFHDLQRAAHSEMKSSRASKLYQVRLNAGAMHGASNAATNILISPNDTIRQQAGSSATNVPRLTYLKISAPALVSFRGIHGLGTPTLALIIDI